MYKIAYYSTEAGKHQTAISGDGETRKDTFIREQQEAPGALGASCLLAGTLTHRPGLGTQVGFKVIII